ncbi:IS630 family transposase [candidate division KSB1 bacterium]|nr:IS630 family transposase [candidate division KSB1 bacterium]
MNHLIHSLGFSFKQLSLFPTKAVKAWIEKGTIKYIRTNTGRNRLNLNGAYNPNNQDVIIREDYTINAQSTIKLFKQIETQYHNANSIYAFSDNAKYYKCKLITEYLKTSRIKLIFLPPYSPNLNLIERLWKFMRKEVINTTYYPEFQSFKTAIRNFYENIDKYKKELKQFIGNKFQLIDVNIKTTLA